MLKMTGIELELISDPEIHNDKVAKNIFWTGAGGPRLIRNFGEVALT